VFFSLDKDFIDCYKDYTLGRVHKVSPLWGGAAVPRYFGRRLSFLTLILDKNNKFYKNYSFTEGHRGFYYWQSPVIMLHMPESFWFSGMIGPLFAFPPRRPLL
jgi:hypothetical protein